MVQPPQGEVVFAWLHLSDVHFGHGDDAHRWSQQQVTEALIPDIERCIKRQNEPAPPPQAIFLTGDIASRGRPDEYELAASWLRQLQTVTGLKRRDIFLVPGNHDIQRTQQSDRQAWRLLASLRDEPHEQIDQALTDSEDRAFLTRRLNAYLSFAHRYAPAALAEPSGPEQWLFWRHHFNVASDFRVRLVGLNTALLCNDDHDKGCLQLGSWQARALPASRHSGELVIVLCHHPFSWLSDEGSEHVRGIELAGDVLLSGHVHVAELRQSSTASGKNLIHLVAGAVHGEKDSRQQGYRITALMRAPDGTLHLRDWPRRWSLDDHRYERDSSNLPPDEDVAQSASMPLKKLHAMAAPVQPERPVSLTPLDRLKGYTITDDATRDWVVDPRDAREWLRVLGFRPNQLLKGHLVCDDGAAALAADSARSEWRAETIEAIRQEARRRTPAGVAACVLHGVRGIGKTTLLLRYIAATPRGDVRLVVDCGSHAGDELNGAHEDLTARLTTLPADADNVFIAVDGLDVACRAIAVNKGAQAKEYLGPAIEYFRKRIEDALPGRHAVVLFVIDDYPDPGRTGASEVGWATEAAQKLAGNNSFTLFCTLDSAFETEDLAIRERILPGPWTPEPDVMAFLHLPIFFDAVRDREPFRVLGLRTKRQVLALGMDRAGRLGVRCHAYYKVLPALNRFVEALALASEGNGDDVQAWLEMIELEITGEWMFLFDSDGSDSDVAIRLSQLHTKLLRESSRYVTTFAMSNVITLLDTLRLLTLEDVTYEHCNLRNALLVNGPRIRRAEFYGVDFRGARIERGTVSAEFFGNDFRGARFDGTSLENESRFVGCRFDSDTFRNATCSRDVEFIASIAPAGWQSPTGHGN